MNRLKIAAAGAVFGCLAALSTARSLAAEPKVDFDRQVRPILSENCFACHGPDEQKRKAKLRLDIRDEAMRPAKSGDRAIIPNDPEKSRLVSRVSSQDPDEKMPPPDSGKKLSSEQIDLLRRWISQGAPYARHWSYIKPVRPPLPTVKNASWPRNGLDYFILARLEREGLQPSAEADRYALVRRLSLDLTGLPPTITEVDQFVNDASSDAYEKLVDRLLAKEAFGEHWARVWLDLARYADSAGYADDPLRSIWAFRDYVIKAFNMNKPFDQFTVEQLAGDLLPEPSEEQLVATAFHRNTMTNSEGGTNDEEFRNAAIVDRVNTTMAVWMGTSIACAQCHSHKYDPISQDEYFQFFALLNNTEDADRSDEAPNLNFFLRPQKEKRNKLETQIGGLEKILATEKPEYWPGYYQWSEGFPELKWDVLKPAKVDYAREVGVKTNEDGVIRIGAGPVKDTYTLELPLKGAQFTGLRLEAVPDGSLPGKGSGNGADGNFVVSRVAVTVVPANPNVVPARFLRIEIPGKEKILSLAEVQVFSGEENVAPKGAASQSSTEYEAEAVRAIDGKTDGDFAAKSTTHTKTSENPWWELDLKQVRQVGKVVIWNRTDNDNGKRLKDFKVTAFDEKREVLWETQIKDAPSPNTELAVDGRRAVSFAAAYVDVAEDGSDPMSVLGDKADPKKGWTTGKADGQPHWLALIPSRTLTFAEGAKLKIVIEQNSEKKDATLGSFKLAATDDSTLLNYGKISSPILTLLSRRSEGNTEEAEKKLFSYYLRNVATELLSERTQVADLQKQLDGIKPYTVPVMHELAGDKRRKTKLQFRGNFADTGKEEAEGVPAAFHPLPEGAPRNRLTLAKWLIDRNNPLTPRVIANRFWEQIFGIGIVRTSEEFGAQGEPPSNAELLDWLAVELSQSWDVKQFLKTLVTSAAYRQSSKVTKELEERDPDNRLLARGPRFRMSAEMVRDQALFVSGLLSPKMYGPSVKPPRPSSGLSAAFGSSIDWKTSDGEDRFRRALYTEWRRTSPYPSMSTFDAPNREVCALRRTRTNTPLQALVTLNDPVYLEAAQALARRMAARGSSVADRIRHGFRLCLARNPSDKELARLVSLFGETISDYAKGTPEKAKQLATEPRGPLPEGSDPLEMAAWTTVANVLLNLDETLMKR